MKALKSQNAKAFMYVTPLIVFLKIYEYELILTIRK